MKKRVLRIDPLRQLPALLALVGLAGSTAISGCLYDDSERCGASQYYDEENNQCLCEDGFGLVDRQCVKCGANEVGSLEGCACAEGFRRASEGMPCVKVETLGQACASASECKSDVFNICQTQGNAGYCTSSCETSEQCETALNYACSAAKKVCERPPTGLGTTCSSSADCAGFEADYCEAIVYKKCLKQGCKADPDTCHGDWACCDLTVLSTSLCVPPYELVDGKCPAGGTLIPRGE